MSAQVRLLGVLRQYSSLQRQLLTRPTNYKQQFNVVPIQIHQSRREYKNFSQKPEDTPTITKFFHGFILVSFIVIMFDWK